MIELSSYYNASVSERGVAISSSLEPSYFKSLNNDFPENRFRDTTPKSGEGPWAISRPRNRDGSMDVEAGMTYSVSTANGSLPGWRGSAGLHAHEPGFVLPDRTWSLSGITAITTPDPKASSVGIGIRINGPKSGEGVPEPSSSVTLTTVEQGYPFHGQGLDAHYNIQWRLPVTKDRDLPLPAGMSPFLWQYSSMGALSQPVEANSDIPTVTISYDPWYIQFWNALPEAAGTLGEVVDVWFGRTDIVEVLAAVKTVGAATAPASSNVSCSQNSEGMFTMARDLDNRSQIDADITAGLPASYLPLTPLGVPFSRCRLIEALHYRVYEHKLTQLDLFDANGYAGPRKTLWNKWVEGGFIGRYAPSDPSGGE